MTVTNAYMEFKPSLWQRICWWHRWPWRPRMVHPDKHEWDAPWVTVVRQNSTIIGWHTDEKRPTGFGVGPDRWACLWGLVTGRLRFDIEYMPGERREAPSLSPREQAMVDAGWSTEDVLSKTRRPE